MSEDSTVFGGHFSDAVEGGLGNDCCDAQRAFYELVENLTDAIYTTDRDGIVTYVSPSVERVLGYTQDEVIGSRYDTYVAPDDLDRIRRAFEHILNNDASDTNEYTFLTKSGDQRRILASSRRRVFRGRVMGLQGVLTDVTEQRKTEKKLQESEARYHAIIEDLPVLLCCFDSDGRITFVNKAYCDYFGRQRDEFLGASFMELIPEDDRSFVMEKYTSLTSDNPVTTYEHKVINSRGEIRWQLWTDRAIFDEDGRLLSYKSIGQDITSRRNLEEKLRQSEKLDAIGLLAGGIAHDFNNQLTAILGGTEMLQRCLGGDEVARSSLEMIIRAAQRSSDMAGKLLAFARKGRRRSVIVDMHQLIKEVVELLKATLQENIDLTTDLRADPSTTTGDPTQLQRALLNIALNARDAMPSGGSLRITTAIVPCPLEPESPESLAGRRCIEISIRDTGTGMDYETLRGIFEPFFTTKPEGSGTGMGLPASYGAVKAHDGHIEVESEPGVGSRFRVYLPLTDSPPEVTESTAACRDSALGALVMLVDDDEAVRGAACGMLEALGYLPVGFADGREAIEYFRTRNEDVDVVLLDLLMPGISGAETFRHLRRISPDARIVLCTGYSIDATSEQFEGAAGVLTKPFSMATLGEVIDQALKDARRG